MSIPQTPSAIDLSKHLTNTTKLTKIYRFKFTTNWNIKQTVGVLNQFSGKDFRNLSNLAKALNEQRGLMDELKNLKKTAENANEAKKVSDALVQKVPGTDKVSKAAKIGANYVALLGIGGIAGIVAIKTKLDEFIQRQQEKTTDILSRDLTKTNELAVRANLAVREVNGRIADLNRQIDKQSIESLNASRNATTAREKANDALYEVRQGRVKLDAQVAEAKKQANDALYETRKGREIIDQSITSLKASFNGLSNSIKEVVNNTKTAIANAQKAQADATAANSKVNATNSEVNKVATQINGISSILNSVKSTVQDAMKLATSANDAVNKLPATINQKVAEVIKPQIEPVQRQGDENSKKIGNIQQQITIVVNNQSNTTNAINTATNNVSGVLYEVGQLKQQNQQIETQLKTIQPQINKINQDLLITKDMDKEANLKLDKIMPFLGMIPLIPMKVADTIKPSIPTIPQIEQAATTGVCRSTQPGGCMNNALNGMGNTINNNVNNRAGDILGGVNAAANGLELGILKVIDEKLGEQLPGGLSATFGRLWRTLRVDRILNMLTYITVLHNALMLSNNIGQTLFSGINNIARAAGFEWRNESGDSVGFGGLVSQWTTGFFKAIFGAENYTQMVQAYQAANRMYQSATNMLWQVQSMFDSVRNIAEMTANNTGKIGNALKRAGVIFENAFPNMSERTTARTATQARWDDIVNGLQPVENAVTAFSSITGEIVSVGDNFNELKQQRNEFLKSKDEGEKTVTALITGEKVASTVKKDVTETDVRRTSL